MSPHDYPARSPFRARRGQQLDPYGIADLMRAAAAGREANGDHDGARRARAGARMLARKDGPGERYRKHVRTRAQVMPWFR